MLIKIKNAICKQLLKINCRMQEIEREEHKARLIINGRTVRIRPMGMRKWE